MGYPEERVRNPRDGSLSYSSFVDSARTRRNDGVVLRARRHGADAHRPQPGRNDGGTRPARAGGRLRTTRSRCGTRCATKPRTRTTIVDPFDGERASRGRTQGSLRGGDRNRHSCRGSCSVNGTCSKRLHEIPDTVEEFTGYLARVGSDRRQFRARGALSSATGTAQVRNVVLPPAASHITAPAGARARARSGDAGVDRRLRRRRERRSCRSKQARTFRNLLHAADIWYSVKKHWCLEAQHMIRALRKNASARQ